MKVGDKVMYSKKWLQSVGVYSGYLPFAKGVIEAIKTVGSLTIADVRFNHEDRCTSVNVANLTRKEDIPFED